jgi:hypothetical protein
METTHKIVSRDEWVEARMLHLKQEKELTRLRDELSAQRRDLSLRLMRSHGCFFVRLTGAVSPSRPDHPKASRAAVVKHGRRPPRSGARRA